MPVLLLTYFLVKTNNKRLLQWKKTEEILSCYNVHTCINCKFEQREILYVLCIVYALQ